MAEALDPLSFEAALTALAQQAAAARAAHQEAAQSASPQPSPRRWGEGHPRFKGIQAPDLQQELSPRSPVPQWLVDQQRGQPAHADNAPWMADQGSDVGPVVSTASELTGAPSVYRGTKKMLDDDPRFLHKAAGAAEAALGAAPIAGQVIRPIGAALSVATQTLPRFMATMTAPKLLEVADSERLDDTVKAALAPEAQAQTAQWETPTDQQKRNRAWVQQQQDRLTEKGLYPKNAPGYGSYGGATEDALKREWKADRDAERDRVRKEQMETRRLDLETTQAETAKQEAATKKANEQRQQQASQEAGARKIKADAARDEIRTADENSPVTRFLRSSAPYLATIPGAVAGHYLGKAIGGRMEEAARSRIANAEEILTGNPNFGDKVGALNSFYSYPGAQSLWPWQKPEPLFLRTNASKAPYWKPNKDAPQSAELYPATKPYFANMAGPAVLGTAEMASGFAGSRWQGGKKDAAEAAMADPNASEADVRGAAARRDSAANAQAWFDALNNFGRGTAGYGMVKGGVSAATQPPMRPSNIGTADAWREDVMKQLAKTKAKTEADKAKAAAAQQAATAPAPGGKPNGAGSAASLLPLAAGPLLPGSQPRTEADQAGSEPQAAPIELPEHLAPTPWGVRDRASGKFTKSPDSSRMSVPAKGERTDNAPPIGYSRPNPLLDLMR